MTECDNKQKQEFTNIISDLEAYVGDLEFLVDEKDLAGRELRDADRKSKAWLDHSPMCTKVIDKDLNLQFMSRAGIRDLKLDDISEHYGKPYPLSFYPEEFRNNMTACLKRSMTTCEVNTLESSIVDTEGRTLWFHSTVVPVMDDDGVFEYLMVVSTNTTERVEAEKQRGQLEAQLAETQRLKSMQAIGCGLTQEISGPIKAIRSDVRFIQTACGMLAPLLESAHQLAEAVSAGDDALEWANELKESMAEIDFEFLSHEMPRAVVESLRSLENVQTLANTLGDCGVDEIEDGLF